MKDLLELGTCNVTLDYLSAVAQQGTRATRGDEARDAMKPSEAWIAGISDKMDRGEPEQAI